MTSTQKILLKRTTTPGKVPVVGVDCQSGEACVNLPDQKVFENDGVNVFEIGANLTSLVVATNTTTTTMRIGNTTCFFTVNSAGMFYTNTSVTALKVDLFGGAVFGG